MIQVLFTDNSVATMLGGHWTSSNKRLQGLLNTKVNIDRPDMSTSIPRADKYLVDKALEVFSGRIVQDVLEPEEENVPSRVY